MVFSLAFFSLSPSAPGSLQDDPQGFCPCDPQPLGLLIQPFFFVCVLGKQLESSFKFQPHSLLEMLPPLSLTLV